MAHRTVLTERQRSALFDLPTDEASILQHYILSDEVPEIIGTRRRARNQFGFALQWAGIVAPKRPKAPFRVPWHLVPLEGDGDA